MEEPFDVEGLEFRCVQFSLTWGEVAMETLQIAKDHGWEEPNQTDPEFDPQYEYPGLEFSKARFQRMLAKAEAAFPDLVVAEEAEEESK
jgi:hypothetical protein